MIKNQNKIHLSCAADLQPEPIDWLWPGWLAAGKFHLLAGSPGTGKTTLALKVAATVSRGGQWPDGSICEPGNVLIWSGEDSVEDTLLPRLLAQGVDQNRVYFIESVTQNNKTRAFDPAYDLHQLYTEALRMGGVQLIVIDPVVHAVGGDSHKNGEVRRGLQPLVDLSTQLKAAIIGITHFSKGTLGRDPLERVNGSIAFAALARIVWVTANRQDPQGKNKYLLVRVKSNHGTDGGGYHYQIEQTKLPDYPDIDASCLVWRGWVEGSAGILLADSAHAFPHEGSMLAEAMEFLKGLLADGPVPKQEIDAKAQEAGFKEISLRRAKTILGVEAIHEGYGKGSAWKWFLPSKVITKPKDAHCFGLSTFASSDEQL